MTSRDGYLLDPAILVAIRNWEYDRSLTIIDWCHDPRARLGTASRRAVVSLLLDVQSGELNGPPKALRRLLGAAIQSLLVRAPFDAGRPPENLYFSPEYAGTSDNRELMELDLHDHSLEHPVYVGTEDDAWRRVDTVDVRPGDLQKFEVLPRPGLPTDAELLAKRRSYWQGRRILIVGGQVETRVLRAILSEFDIPGKSLSWEASEYNKSPRNLDDQIAGLASQTGAVVISIVGKMGHSTSGKIKTNCGKAQVALIELESSAQIVEALRRLADG